MKEVPTATPLPCSITTAVIRSITIMDIMRILGGQTRRKEASSPQSRTGPQQHSYPALLFAVTLECSVSSSVRISRNGVVVTNRRPAILEAISSKPMAPSSALITYSGEISIATIILMAASTVGSGVRAPFRRACIHGTTMKMATLTATCCSPVQTSQTR